MVCDGQATRRTDGKSNLQKLVPHLKSKTGPDSASSLTMYFTKITD